MRKTIKLLAAFLIALCGCQEEVTLTKDSQQIVLVNAESGVHSFGVTVDGGWSVSMDEASAEWCEFVGPAYGSGAGAFSVKYKANVSDGVRRGLRRQAQFTVITDDRFTSVTILFRQGGLTPYVEFKEQTYEIEATSEVNVLAVNTNLSSYEAGDVVVSVEGDWVTDSRLSLNGAELTIFSSANGSGSKRSAVAEISYTDCWGETFKDTAEIVQAQ